MDYIIINGPNLNLLGAREVDIYGSRSFEDYLSDLRLIFDTIDIHYYQSNHEGALIDKLHEVGFLVKGIVLNAAAYTHTSIALADAVKAIAAPVVEVHISDINARESFRHRSFLKDVCMASIVGEGLAGYERAIRILMTGRTDP